MSKKFQLLMWKNFLLQYRNPVQTLFEVLLPILFCGILIILRMNVKTDVVKKPTIYSSYFPDSFVLPVKEEERPNVAERRLVYYPQNDLLGNLTVLAAEKLKLQGADGVNSTQALADAMVHRQVFACIEFKHNASLTKLPANLSYAIRFPSELRKGGTFFISNWVTNLRYDPWLSSGGPRSRQGDFKDIFGGLPFYHSEGFLAIQNAFAYAFLETNLNPANRNVTRIKMNSFPYPPYTYDVLLSVLKYIFSLFLTLCFIYPCMNTVRFIVFEKEKQLKTVMEIMGVSNCLQWFTWFIRTMIIMLISITLITLSLKVGISESGSIFRHSNGLIIFLYLFVYSISMTTFSFMLSVLFSKANVASATAGAVWFVLYVPYLCTIQFETLWKFVACIGTNSAMAYGFEMIQRLEGNGIGLQWSNLFRPIADYDDQLTIGITICFVLGEALLYLLVALCVDRAKPKHFGIPKKSAMGSDANDESNNFEDEQQLQRIGVQVQNLGKTFGEKIACKNLNLNAYENQILVLLGNNGSGKSTAISMMVGMIQPTSGNIIINGTDIRKGSRHAGNSIGFCLQQNIFFDEFTVHEQFQFFTHLKGLSGKDAENEVSKYLELLEFKPKMNALTSSLSFGMKRKLSVGLALCGRSRVVFCDEPTSGMDPIARRALWNLLQREKKDRTILLSTHFIDEANVLGDRIAIMAEGELKCCGSSFFLKKRFNVGYRLVCVKKDDCNAADVTEIVNNIIPGAQAQIVANELVYKLPTRYTMRFQQMFERLETKQKLLKLQGFGISLNTLEDVFFKVGSFLNDDQVNNNATAMNSENDKDIESMDANSNQSISWCLLIISHWIAMFKKRFIFWKRNWILFLLPNLILIVFTVMSIVSVKTLTEYILLPELDLSLSSYNKTVTMLSPLIRDDTAKYYRNIIQDLGPNHKLEMVPGDTITRDHFLNLARTMHYRLNREYLAGLAFSVNVYVAWFNPEPFHSTAISLNLAHNALIKSYLGSGYSISVTNKPFKFINKFEKGSVQLRDLTNLGFMLAIFITFAMAFTSSFYIIFYIKERVSQAKLLQFVSGLSVSTFWITSIIFDLINYIFNTVIVMAVIFAFQMDGWKTMDELIPLFVSLLVFGPSMLGIVYLLSRLFSMPSTGFIRMSIFFLCTGTIMLLLFVGVMNQDDLQLKGMVDDFKPYILVFPHYALSSCISNMNEVFGKYTECVLQNAHVGKQACKMGDIFAYDDPGIRRNLYYMAGTGIVCYVLLFIIEFRIIRSLIYCISAKSKLKLPEKNADDGPIDNDITAEKERVDGMAPDDLQTHDLVLKDLTKLYGKIVAVNQVSVGIKGAECFGLLGTNEAGKTSLYKMIIGDEIISGGEIYVCGGRLKYHVSNARKNTGYCPQSNAFFKEFTGAETLELFSRLRGIHPSDISELIAQFATELNFVEHLDKRIDEYSGGDRRKLSTAIALIGNPSLICLDDPTRAMDPFAKRKLWTLLSKVREQGKTVVLTSNSMEDCEALCTQLTFMKNGELKCLGSSQYLKNKFSNGFSLRIKVKNVDNSNDSNALQKFNARASQVKAFMRITLPDAKLREEYNGILAYYVPPARNRKWSTVFGLMEKATRNIQIEDYIVSQTTLEQTLLSFTKDQSGETRVKKQKKRRRRRLPNVRRRKF